MGVPVTRDMGHQDKAVTFHMIGFDICASY